VPQTDPPDDRTQALRRALGIRVQQVRHWRRLSQTTLAHDAGMHRSTLQRIERGQTAVSVDRLWALAHRLDVEPDVLLARQWSPPTEDIAAAGTWPEGAPPEHHP
jgi:transcriptional regulator with XRE-family HTH domain